MSVIAALLLTSSNANGCSCVSLYYVLILLVVLLYRILRPMIFIPRFAEIWGPTSICGSARALYRALVRPEGRAFFSQYGEPAKLCQDEPATTSSARFISTSDADKPPQKCIKEKRSGDLSLLPPRISEIPRFCLRRKSLHLLSKFSPPEATRLQLVMPQTPQGL